MMSHLLSDANHTAQWYQGSYPNAEVFTHLEKFVLHTTETTGWPGYDGGAKAPNATYYPRLREIRQHFYSDRSSRALQDPTSTPVRENRDNVFQLEIVSYSQKSVGDSVGGLWIGNLSDAHYEDIADIMKELHEDLDLPLQESVPWKEGATSFYSVPRLTSSGYDSYKGYLGHIHVPGNTHWDPGGFRASKLNAKLEESMALSAEDKRWILANVPNGVWNRKLVNIPQTRAARLKDPNAKTVYTEADGMTSYNHLRIVEILKLLQNPTQLAELLAAELPPDQTVTKEVLVAALTTVLGSVDEPALTN
jgi:hypothetical protein